MIAIGICIYFAISASIILLYSLLVVRYHQVEHLLKYFLLVRRFWQFAGPLGMIAILAGGSVLDQRTVEMEIAFGLFAILAFVVGSRYLVWLIAMAAHRRYIKGETIADISARATLAFTMKIWPKQFRKVARRHATDLVRMRRELCGDTDAQR